MASRCERDCVAESSWSWNRRSVRSWSRWFRRINTEPRRDLQPTLNPKHRRPSPPAYIGEPQLPTASPTRANRSIWFASATAGCAWLVDTARKKNSVQFLKKKPSHSANEQLAAVDDGHDREAVVRCLLQHLRMDRRNIHHSSESVTTNHIGYHLLESPCVAKRRTGTCRFVTWPCSHNAGSNSSHCQPRVAFLHDHTITCCTFCNKNGCILD